MNGKWQIAISAIVFLLVGSWGVISVYSDKAFWGGSVLADDGESGGSGSGSGSSNEEDSNEKAREQEKKKAEKARESEKRKREFERETEKKRMEASREALKQRGEFEKEGLRQEDQNEEEDDHGGQGGDELSDEADEIDDHEDDLDDDTLKDRTKTAEKLAQEIEQARKKILEAQAKGANVTAALATLAEAEAKINEVNGAFDENDLEAAKRLAKEVKKLAHFAKNEDVHDARKVAKAVEHVEKRIGQTERKLATLESLGGDATALRSTLDGYASEFDTIKARLSADGSTVGQDLVTLNVLERKIKRLKSSIEGAIFALGGTDDEFEDEHQEDIADVAEGLREVGEIEDGEVSDDLNEIADQQENSAATVKNLVKRSQSRGKLVKALLGSSQAILGQVEQEIQANAARIASLKTLVSSITDPELQGIVNDQIEALEQQNQVLNTFLANEQSHTGIFGWLSRLVS